MISITTSSTTITMTLKDQEKTNILPFSGKNSSNQFVGKHELVASQCDVQISRKINPVWTVELLFGKRHWVSKWVIGLCESDPQFLLHLIDQSPDYVHFICLVRLALLEQSVSEKKQLAYAALIRTKSRKKIIQKLYPSASKGILGVLSKLQKRPLSQENYRQLIRALANDTMRKHLCHAKRVRKFDIDMLGMLKNIPKEFQVKGIVNCIKNLNDYKQLLLLIKVAQISNLEITRQEAETATRKMNKMDQIQQWLKKKLEILPFPSPPWQGNEWIKPVCSRNEMQVVADRFRNCVMRYVPQVIFGSSYFYVCERPLAVIEVQRDVVFGWGVDEIEREYPRWEDHRPIREEVTCVQRREIIQEFTNAGFLPIEPHKIDHLLFC